MTEKSRLKVYNFRIKLILLPCRDNAQFMQPMTVNRFPTSDLELLLTLNALST